MPAAVLMMSHQLCSLLAAVLLTILHQPLCAMHTAALFIVNLSSTPGLVSASGLLLVFYAVLLSACKPFTGLPFVTRHTEQQKQACNDAELPLRYGRFKTCMHYVLHMHTRAHQDTWYVCTRACINIAITPWSCYSVFRVHVVEYGSSSQSQCHCALQCAATTSNTEV
jgi:hypothetical protein